jgi:hypothetical protein
MAEPNIKDNVKQLMSDLPVPIKNFLLEKLDGIAQALMQKYGLHLDQGAVLQRDLMLVLLGAREPGALAENLKQEARLDDKTLNAILEDVNKQVFVPLRQQLEAKPGEAPVSTTGPKPAQATPAAPPKSPQFSPPPRPVAPTMSTPMRDKTLNRLAPQGVGVSTPMPRVAAQPPANLPGVIQSRTPAPASPKAPLAAALKVAGVLRLEDHEEPRIEFRKPVAPPPAPAPSAPAQAVMLQPQTKPPAPTIAQSPVKNYNVDPYREPVDENETDR